MVVKRKLPGGIVCPLAVPLDNDENLDVPGLLRLLDYVLPDVDGILVLGSTGEFAYLTEYVADKVVEVTLEHINGRVPFYVGISEAGTRRAMQLLRRAQRSGVDFVVACSPYYYTYDSQTSLVEHFERIADASPVPLILYNIPQNTAMNLTVASVEQLAAHPNIVGIKDSWGDMFQFQEFLKLRSDGFTIMQGREQLAAISLWAGADGIVSALPNIAPKMLPRLARAVSENDHDVALEIQWEITRTAQIFDQGYWLSALKVALRELGIGNGVVSRPIPECTPAQIATIRRLLIQAQLLP